MENCSRASGHFARLRRGLFSVKDRIRSCASNSTSIQGQQYSIEATTNFFNWQGLITNTADANGLFQFDDTNAPSISFRFYRSNLTRRESQRSA